jgi:hypothetical protein
MVDRRASGRQGGGSRTLVRAVPRGCGQVGSREARVDRKVHAFNEFAGEVPNIAHRRLRPESARGCRGLAGTKIIGDTGVCFERNLARGVCGRSNRKQRLGRGRSPSGCNHSLNLSGHRIDLSPGRPFSKILVLLKLLTPPAGAMRQREWQNPIRLAKTSPLLPVCTKLDADGDRRSSNAMP